MLRLSIFLLAKWDGRIKKASTKENNKQAITLKAISCIISISPPTNSNVENANTVVNTDVKTAFITSVVPSSAAFIGDLPLSKCAYIFSAITIPSSTKIPTTSIIPNNEIILIVIPYMIPKEIIPIKENGIPKATHKESRRLKNKPKTKQTKNNPTTRL